MQYTIYEVEFSPNGRTYSYLAGEEPFEIGDSVVVLAGKDSREAIVRIVAKRCCRGNELPVSIGKMKQIVRRANDSEGSSFGKEKPQKPKKSKRAKANVEDLRKDPIVYEGFQEDGSFVFSYEDYGVDFYDGADVEVIYKLDAENAEKLRMFLGKKYVGGLEYMLVQECGSDYRKKAPTELFDEAGVKYESFTWIA